MPEKELPKILYLADVPVELSSAGATLLYRLLEYYPKDKLLIIQGVGVSETQPRIPGVAYHVAKTALERLRYTRFSKYLKGLFLATEVLGSSKTRMLIRSFKPDIILTVSIRLMWVNAYRISKQLNIPLYLVLHDEWLTSENYGKWQNYLVRMFEKMYKHATDRFCISPAMEKYYFSLYGVHGKIILPLRGKEDHVFPVVTDRKLKGKVIKFCYAGSLFTGDFAAMLDMVAFEIGEMKGELHIFSYWNKEVLARYKNLCSKHVFIHPFMHATELMRKMNEEMDVAVLLNSFEHEKSFKYNFSSKLVDYISAGLPVLFWGPASSGSNKWATSLGYDAIVTTRNPDEVANLVKAFYDEQKRLNWANEIRRLGINEFSFEKNYEIFIHSISV